MQDSLVIFDCDGVLVDSEVISARVEARELTKLGYSISFEEDIRRFTGKTQKDILITVENELGRKIPEGFEKLLSQKISQALTDELVAIDGVHHILSMIRNKCVASNGEIKKIANSLKVTGLDVFFSPESCFSAEMVSNGKPAPDLFLYAAKKMGYNPSSCIVIEDSITGVCAAKSAGMKVLGFLGASHILDTQHGDLLKSAGACEIFSSMQELPNLLFSQTVLNNGKNHKYL